YSTSRLRRHAPAARPSLTIPLRGAVSPPNVDQPDDHPRRHSLRVYLFGLVAYSERREASPPTAQGGCRTMDRAAARPSDDDSGDLERLQRLLLPVGGDRGGRIRPADALWWRGPRVWRTARQPGAQAASAPLLGCATAPR